MVMQGLISGLGGFGAAAGQVPPRRRGVGQPFKRVLAHADLWDSSLETSSNSILCTAGLYVNIGRYTVPAQQQIRFGYGSAAFPDNQGYVYIKLYDDTGTNSVQEVGTVRLAQENALGTRLRIVSEIRTEQLAGSTTDRQQQFALPEQIAHPRVGEDSKLLIAFKADATDTLVETAIGTAAGADVWNVPVTVYQ